MSNKKYYFLANNFDSLGTAEVRTVEVKVLANLCGKQTTNKVIPFPSVRGICRSYKIKKENFWKILHKLEESDMIKIVPYRGVICTSKGMRKVQI
jgi:hypothetical protein